MGKINTTFGKKQHETPVKGVTHQGWITIIALINAVPNGRILRSKQRQASNGHQAGQCPSKLKGYRGAGTLGCCSRFSRCICSCSRRFFWCSV